MSQESQTPQIHIKRCVELSSLQNEPSSAYNEPESSETSKKKECKNPFTAENYRSKDNYYTLNLE
ncbi:hypothetical protein Glove_202g12 [Diversispora epigaea]|uniref:Uncharacterized protein n=1 Tax=Diversispora epigaea TaxID=1348612 RepID=A0A397IJX8_9GLOM|nr:hypothetical protein Glove_202g12 [Diversispora epigaea]